MKSWQELSPEERGVIRETIHRRLLQHERHTETGLMHACGFSLETIREAVSAMAKSGALAVESDGKRTYYNAKKREPIPSLRGQPAKS